MDSQLVGLEISVTVTAELRKQDPASLPAHLFYMKLDFDFIEG